LFHAITSKYLVKTLPVCGHASRLDHVENWCNVARAIINGRSAEKDEFASCTAPDSNTVRALLTTIPCVVNLLDPGKLGTSSGPLDELFVSNATVQSGLSIAEGATITISSGLQPGSNSAYDVGSASNQWKVVYAEEASLSGSLSASGAMLSGDLEMGSNSISFTWDTNLGAVEVGNRLTVHDISGDLNGFVPE
jgi:hypothetical protein